MPRACPVCASVYSSDSEFCASDGAKLMAGDPFIGRTFGRYEIVSLLGAGAHGAVYLAHDRKTHTEVAIKVLKNLGSGKPDVRRFEREAEAIRTIKHPNVVSIVDFGMEGRVLYLAMEYLRGPTLADVLAREHSLVPQRAIRIARQIADALGHAHRSGFVHRDLKPSNVVLVRENGDENVRLVDFGVAGYIDDSAQNTRLTRDGATVGSPAYMAPEQVFDSTVGPTADIYALGIVLYEMLTGSVPFTGSIHEVALQQVAKAPNPLPPLGGLSELVMRMLEKKPENRLADVRLVIEELDQIARGIEVTKLASTTLPTTGDLEPAGPTAVGNKPKTGSSWPIWAAAGIATIVLALYLGRPQPKPDAIVVPPVEKPRAPIAPPEPAPEPAPTATTAVPEVIQPIPSPSRDEPRKDVPKKGSSKRPVIEPQAEEPPALKIDLARVKDTLDRVEEALESSASPERDQLYLEYLDLRTATRPGLSPAQYLALEKKARDLLARVIR